MWASTVAADIVDTHLRCKVQLLLRPGLEAGGVEEGGALARSLVLVTPVHHHLPAVDAVSGRQRTVRRRADLGVVVVGYGTAQPGPVRYVGSRRLAHRQGEAVIVTQGAARS